MTPLAWLGILAILLVIEAITVGLTTVWFAGGALVACIARGLVGNCCTAPFIFRSFRGASDLYQTSGGPLHEQGRGKDQCREPSGKKSRSDTAGQQPGPDRAGEDQ
mgnify:CR=1 FL=1